MSGTGRGASELRVAFLMHSFPEWSETFLLRQVVGLLDRGHEVALFCRESGATSPVHPSVERYRILGRILHTDAPRGAPSRRWARAGRALRDLASHRALVRPFVAAGGRPLLDATAFRFAAALEREGPFDVVHAHYGDVGLDLRAAAASVAAPLVVSFYGYDCSSYPRRHGPGVFAPLFARAAAVTSLGERMTERLRALGCPEEKIRIHRIGVDARSFTPRPRAREGAPRLLTVARLVEKKGVRTVLAALARLAPEFPGLGYDVVGDGPLRAELERLAEATGLGARIRFHGAQPEDRVVELMRAATAFVLASETAADGDEEGTPTVLMEASSVGLPVVSTWHSGIPEVVRDGHTGLLAPPGDPAALADCLRRLLRDPEEARRLGEAGRAHVAANHDMPLLTRRLEDLYAEARSGGLAPPS